MLVDTKLSTVSWTDHRIPISYDTVDHFVAEDRDTFVVDEKLYMAKLLSSPN